METPNEGVTLIVVLDPAYAVGLRRIISETVKATVDKIVACFLVAFKIDRIVDIVVHHFVGSSPGVTRSL